MESVQAVSKLKVLPDSRLQVVAGVTHYILPNTRMFYYADMPWKEHVWLRILRVHKEIFV